VGFREPARVEAPLEPDKAQRGWNAILRHYGLPIWRERGDLPRAAPPAGSRLRDARALALEPPIDLRCPARATTEGIKLTSVLADPGGRPIPDFLPHQH